uniref:Uncharacterized protein MANES_03G200700 n=1 Tax=Rhizophora mucronata TaxID=61149 RepID=A0A2P2J3H5_RHIMU
MKRRTGTPTTRIDRTPLFSPSPPPPLQHNFSEPPPSAAVVVAAGLGCH